MQQKCVCVQKLILCIILMALVAPFAWPQASSATSSGTVRDESGAVVPGASVALTNTATNVALKTQTNETGFYFFPGINPGPYSLTVEAPGMQKFAGSMTVQTQQSAVVNVVLKVGQTSTTIAVADVTPLVQVDNPTLGGTLERARIEQLPINERKITNLLQTIPGMEGLRSMGTRGGAFEAVLDGAALGDRNSYANDGKGQITYRQPGLDSIQEFSVENNAASAKFSRPTSIVMTTKGGTNGLHGSLFETNKNNAVGLARKRQDNYSKAPFMNRNEFGASVGGPVYIPKLYNGKNKTFWFFSYEGLRLIEPRSIEMDVPTQAMRNGDMSGLIDGDGFLTKIYDPFSTNTNTWARQAYPNNKIPDSQQNKLAQSLMAATPLPTDAGVNPLLANNYIAPFSLPTKSWTVSTRVDQRIGDRDQFYGRYTQGNYSITQPYYGVPSTNPALPFGTDTVRAPNKSVAVSYVHTFSPTLFNELLVTGSRQLQWDGSGEDGVYYADQLGLPNVTGRAGWPSLVGVADSFFQTDPAYQFKGQATNAYHSFYGIVDDNATKIHGKHELQFGFHYRYDQMNMLPDQQISAGQADFATGATGLVDTAQADYLTNPQAAPHTNDSLANFYLGIAQYMVQINHSYFYLRQKEFAGYLQDNFRATPRLTLNFGLRYEYNTPLREKNHMLTSFDLANHAVVTDTSLQNMYNLAYSDPSIVNTYIAQGAKFETGDQAGMPSGLLTSSKNDFGPRAGFAYKAFDGAKSFVLRGGYSMSYFHIPLYSYGARMRKNAPLLGTFAQTGLTSGSQSPDGLDNYAMRSVPTIFAGTPSDLHAIPANAEDSLYIGSAQASFWAPNQPDGQVQNWNLTLEKEIAANTIVRAGYIGSHSANIETLNSLNNSAPAYIWYLMTGKAQPTGSLSGVAKNAYDQQVYGRVEEWQAWGKSNSNGMQLELQRRYSKGYGYQLFYVVANNLGSGGQGYNQLLNPLNQYIPGTVPADDRTRNDLLNYARDTSIPKHRVSWNWIADLPFGKGKPIFGNAGKFLDRVIGGWQIAGLGTLRSTYFSLPTSNAMFPTGNPVETYGYKYPIQDCTSGKCNPGYLWWNAYISPQLINSHDANGKPNGIEGVPADYKPAVTYLIPYGQTGNAPDGKPYSSYWNTNSAWVTLADGTLTKTTWAGLAPFNNQRLPGILQWGVDASLFKSIPINEQFRLRFQGDFFNVFNHPNNQAGISSTGILSTRYSDNAPRSIQLSLRLSF